MDTLECELEGIWDDRLFLPCSLKTRAKIYLKKNKDKGTKEQCS